MWEYRCRRRPADGVLCRWYGGAVEQVQMKEDLTALRQRVVSELAAIDVVVWPRRKRTRRERLTRFLTHRARKARRIVS